MKYFGCAYYPEAWAKERWETDFRLMRELGFNMIRLGEFNWGKLEPEEGCFHFEETFEVLDLALKYGIRVMMCTPTAAIPRWMHARYPETLKLRADGTRPECDARQSYCPSSPKFRFFADRIVSEMARAFRDHPAIAMWQLDNELSVEAATGLCVCDSCTKRFQEAMRNQYRTLDAFNRAWNGAFWSGDLQAWEDLKPPFRFRRGWKKEYLRVQGELFSELVLHHRDLLKQENPGWVVTTNNPGMTYADLRLDRLFANLGYAACDTYVASDNIFRFRAFWDFYRGITGRQQKFMVAETGAFNQITTEPNSSDALKPWFWEMFARGAESILYFRWRQSVMGEETHPAILPWCGRPGTAYRTIQKIRKEFEALPEDLSNLPLPKTEIALVHDAASGQYHQSKKSDALYVAANRIHLALTALGKNPDFLMMEAATDIAPYRVVFLPLCESVSPRIIETWKEYVQRGGCLVAMTRLNLMEESGSYRKEPYPCGMNDLFGLEIEETRELLTSQTDANMGVFDISSLPKTSVELRCFGQSVRAERYVEHLMPKGCAVLETLSATCFAGAPLLTCHSFGKGKAFYLSAFLDVAGVRLILRRVLEHCGIALPERELPPEVSRIRRGEYLFTINSSARRISIPEERGGRILMGSPDSGNEMAVLNPYEVRIARFGRDGEKKESDSV